MNKPLSSDRIIPAELQNELMHLGEQRSRSSWRIGDIANQVYANARDSSVTQHEVYRAVGYYADCTARTVEYYARVAGFFDSSLREQYDMLSFAHFALISRPPYRDRAEKALELATTGGYNDSRMSVAELERALLVGKLDENDIETPQETVINKGVKVHGQEKLSLRAKPKLYVKTTADTHGDMLRQLLIVLERFANELLNSQTDPAIVQEYREGMSRIKSALSKLERKEESHGI